MPTIAGDGASLLTPDIIAGESLMRLQHELVVPYLLSFNYDEEFTKRVGDTITIKRPYETKVGRGRVMTESDDAPLVDRSIELKVNQHVRWATKWNSKMATLEIEAFYNRYAKTGIEEMAYMYDEDGAEELALKIHATEGTPGTVLSTDIVSDIRAYADELAIPNDMETFALLSPKDRAALEKDLAGERGDSGKFNQDMVRMNIEGKFKGTLSDFDVFTSVNIPYYEVIRPTGMVAGSVNKSGGVTGSEVPTDGWGVNNTKVLKKGTLIQFAGVNDIKPRGNRADLKRPKTFSVLEDVTTDGSGAATIKIEPEINDGSLTTVDEDGDSVSLAAFQNVTAKPIDNAAITIIGLPPSTDDEATYQQSLFFHRGVGEYVPIELEQPSSAVIAGHQTDPDTNMNILFTQAFTQLKLEERMRFDTFYGVGAIYSRLGIRYIGKKM